MPVEMGFECCNNVVFISDEVAAGTANIKPGKPAVENDYAVGDTEPLKL